MLCDEVMALDHSVDITAVGITLPVHCCPECYAMFSDFRTVLQLAPFPFVARQARRFGRPLRTVVGTKGATLIPRLS